MKLLLVRRPSVNGTTHGDLFVDGEWQCCTLEDQVRGYGEKVPKETAIPAGTYTVDITQSARFKRLLPLLWNVKVAGVKSVLNNGVSFNGVRIHPGNTQHDTEGCILVGVGRNGDKVYDSRIAFERLFNRIRGVVILEIEIRNAVEGTS